MKEEKRRENKALENKTKHPKQSDSTAQKGDCHVERSAREMHILVDTIRTSRVDLRMRTRRRQGRGRGHNVDNN